MYYFKWTLSIFYSLKFSRFNAEDVVEWQKYFILHMELHLSNLHNYCFDAVQSWITTK